jgi:hypothetical protein
MRLNYPAHIPQHLFQPPPPALPFWRIGHHIQANQYQFLKVNITTKLLELEASNKNKTRTEISGQTKRKFSELVFKKLGY